MTFKNKLLTLGFCSLLLAPAAPSLAGFSEHKPLPENIVAYDVIETGGAITGCSIPYSYENGDLVNLVYSSSENSLSIQLDFAENFFVSGHSYLLALISNDVYQSGQNDITAEPYMGSDRLYKINISSPASATSGLGRITPLFQDLIDLRALYVWNDDKSRMFHMHDIAQTLSALQDCAPDAAEEFEFIDASNAAELKTKPQGFIDGEAVDIIDATASPALETQDVATIEGEAFEIIDAPETMLEKQDLVDSVRDDMNLNVAPQSLEDYLDQAIQEEDFELVESLTDKIQLLEDEKEALRSRLSSLEAQPLNSLNLEAPSEENTQLTKSVVKRLSTKIQVSKAPPYPEKLKSVEIQEQLTQTKPSTGGWVNFEELDSRISVIKEADASQSPEPEFGDTPLIGQEESFFSRINPLKGFGLFGNDDDSAEDNIARAETNQAERIYETYSGEAIDTQISASPAQDIDDTPSARTIGRNEALINSAFGF